MVIVHPDVIAVFEMWHDRVCEDLVCFAVRHHGAVVERDFVKLIVEQRPDGGVCERSVSICSCGTPAGTLTREAVVVQVGCLLIKHDWNGVVFFQEFCLQE